MKRNACYNCDHRTSGCHAECKEYLEWKRKIEEKRAKRESTEWISYKMAMWVKFKRGER